MKKQPFISIIIPTYNRANKIHNAINSVICQNYSHWEIIVIDDGSKDHTQQIIEQYINKKININYIKLEKNHGTSHARNIGLKYAKGEYIAFLDSDDVWKQEHLYKHIEAMKKYNIKVSFSFWSEKSIDGKENLVFYKNNPLKKKFDKAIDDSYIKVIDNKIAFLKSPKYIEYACIYKVYCNHINTLVMHHEVYEKIGDFDTNLSMSEDDDYSFRILLNYDALVIMEELFIYHQGTDNLYNFSERANINLNKDFEKKEVVDKFSICLENNYEAINKKRSAYLKYGKYANKKAFLTACREQMGWRAFTIAYINKKTNIKKAFKYSLLSIHHMHRKIDYKLFINILFRNEIYKNDDYKSYIHF